MVRGHSSRLTTITAVQTIQVAAAIIATAIQATTAATVQTATAVTTMAIPTRIPATTTAGQAAFQ